MGWETLYKTINCPLVLLIDQQNLNSSTPILSDLPGAPGRGGGLAVPGQRGRGDLSLRQHPRDLRVPAEVPRRPRGGGRRRAQLPHAGRHRTVQGEAEGD